MVFLFIFSTVWNSFKYSDYPFCENMIKLRLGLVTFIIYLLLIHLHENAQNVHKEFLKSVLVFSIFYNIILFFSPFKIISLSNVY